MKSRRTLGVDVELAEEVKRITKSRGMSLAGYLRALLQEAIEVERLGYFAPGVLREKRVELVLSKLGFTYLPLELLHSQSASPEAAETLGVKLGTTLRELGIDCGEVAERISLSNGIGILKEGNLILVPSTGPREILRHFIIGLAKGGRLDVVIAGDLTIVRTKSLGLI